MISEHRSSEPTGNIGSRILRILWHITAIAAIAFLLTSLPGYYLRIMGGFPGHDPIVESNISHSLPLQIFNTLASLTSSVLSLYLARVIYRRLFDNAAVTLVSFFLLFYSVLMTGPLEHWGFYWLGTYEFTIIVQVLLVATPLVALLFLFPNGQFIPLWTRWALIATIPWNIIAFLAPNAFSSGGNITIYSLFFFLWIIFPLLGIYAQIYRYRRVSTSDERQQTKWVLFGFVVWIIYMLVSSIPYFYLSNMPPGTATPWWAPISELGWWLSVNIIPITLGIALLRSRLWNINLVINRTLVYGTLTLITMSLYILVVGILASLLQLGDRSVVAFLTTGLVALLFQPLRERLQGGINRLMYGDRDEPVTVLTKLGEHLENTGSPQDALTGITETVARALKIPYVAIELGEPDINDKIIAAYGLPRNDLVRLPMAYQSESSGTLLLAQRSPGEPFSPAELKLLSNIASQAGAAAQAVKLTADLQQSRQRLVTTREEERRRLRRDLHDGLGPTLASLTLKLDAAINLLPSNPQKVDALLHDLKTQTRETIQDIRAIVYDLRPPALDELGLVGALQNHIDRHNSGKPSLKLQVSEAMSPLPAAFEVAIYRIALEGITNIIRHSQADHGIVRITQDDTGLRIDIQDDGIGLPADRSNGMGLASMRERAEELGGDLHIIPSVRGTHFRAHLPLIEPK